MTTTDEDLHKEVHPGRQRISLGLAVLVTVPGIALRITEPHLPEPLLALLFGLAATTTYPGLASGLRGKDAVAMVAGAVLVIVGVAFKLGAVPAHAWVPDVADGAPVPVAAFLTTVPKIGALVAFGRVVAVLPESAVGWRPVVAVVAAATMTLGNLAALAQDDVRRLLGWSAVSQSGYGLLAVVAIGRSPLAIPSLLYFTAAYAVANMAAFAVVAELRGRSISERARALVAIAHPKFRDELTARAREFGYL